MTDIFSKQKRSDIMSRIRSKNTLPELVFYEAMKVVFGSRVKYRKHPPNVFGKPDLAIPRLRIAMFVDSEFWHGKNFEKWKNRLPKKYWVNKIKKNIDRDKMVSNKLRRSGWSVIRLWSKDVLKKPMLTISRVEKAVIDRQKLLQKRASR